MIWFLLGVAPFVFLLVVWFAKEPMMAAFVVCCTAMVLGFVLLAIYGAWQMDWFNHCGNFWESFSCDGKVITNQ